MKAKIVPSEFTPGAYWIIAPCPKSPGTKLSKSSVDEDGPWLPISSWSSREAAEAALAIYHSLWRSG